jgi:CxxC motif-containing protein (DUF1111 family)
MAKSRVILLTALGALACGSDPGAPPPSLAGGSGGTSSAGAGGASASGGTSAGGAAGSGGIAGSSGAGGSAGSGGSSGSSGSGGASGAGGDPGVGGSGIVPLFNDKTVLEPEVVEDTPTALITRLSDRGRDRHAREDQFQAYEHYLAHYWEHRTVAVEIVDTVGKGGNSVTFNVVTQWKLDSTDLRTFFRGIGTVAEYTDNRGMQRIDDLNYKHVVSRNATENRELRVGDKMEFELSQFLDAPPRGRDNYYGTVFLYIVGRGIVPWAGTGARRDSEMIPESAWLGGHTTVHRNESNEPDNMFLQMAHNMAPQNGQRFMAGRRVLHTSFADGKHDEHAENPIYTELVNKVGPYYINRSCNGCHAGNGRALPPATGATLDKYVVKVGDASGNPDPALGSVLQPVNSGGTAEATVSIGSWTETGGLRKPSYTFKGATPAAHSARVSPQLVGMGLIEAIRESDVAALADPEDANGDGISGRMRVVTDPVTKDLRLGRFGWKAGQAALKHQVAAALRTDIGVMTSVFPTPDCGSAQTNCGPSGSELADTELDNLTAYVALLGMRPQRDWAAANVVKGQELFTSTGCASCHTSTFETTPYHPHAELRSQKIHPYSDLLLHDMGPGLADSLPEGDASGAEWRTTPLWSIGLSAGVAGGESYLHDGRARTLTEAILWHGGEGEKAKNSFSALSEADKTALLAFLKSL